MSAAAEKMPGRVDVEVSFVPRVHDEEQSFDGLEDTLGQTFLSNLDGDLHREDKETKTFNSTEGEEGNIYHV